MIIGLTGSIATGKSTVARMLEELGAVVIDADKIARQVVEPGQPAWFKLRERFGKEVFLENGKLNRKALGAIVFQDEQARQDLNRIVHPEIRKVMEQEKQAAHKQQVEWIVLDIPLLFESGLEHMVDKILVVYVPESLQKKRLIERDQLTEEEANRRINSQLSIEQKKHMGHAYIDNSGSLEETRAQLLHILEQWSREKEA